MVKISHCRAASTMHDLLPMRYEALLGLKKSLILSERGRILSKMKSRNKIAISKETNASP